MRLDEITKAGIPERQKETFTQLFESTDVCVYEVYLKINAIVKYLR